MNAFVVMLMRQYDFPSFEAQVQSLLAHFESILQWCRYPREASNLTIVEEAKSMSQLEKRLETFHLFICELLAGHP